MSVAQKYTDLKYVDETLTIEEVLNTEKVPVVVRNCHSNIQNDVPQDRDVLFKQISKETFAHIKILEFYDNETMQTQKGAEYVLEHDTFVGNEYLMPLKFPGKVQLGRRPRSCERYSTIEQVIVDCPSFVRAEKDTKAYSSSDMEQTVTVPANTILELKRIYNKRKADARFLECSDGDKTYTFSENDSVNFSTIEKNTLYNLEDLSQSPFLPKVILFQGITPHDLVLKDNTLRSAMCTIIEGPIEILGFVDVEYLTCWSRDKHLKSYETIIIPKTLWSKMHVQQRCFHTKEEKETYMSRKFGRCLRSEFVSKSLYLLPLNLDEVTWLRSPEFFKQKLDGNEFYEVIKLPYCGKYRLAQIGIKDGNEFYEVIKLSYCDSSDEDDIYEEIEETPPPIPERDTTSNVKITMPLSETQAKTSEIGQALCKTSVEVNTHSVKQSKTIDKPTNKTDKITKSNQFKNKSKEKQDHSVPRSLPSVPSETKAVGDKKYTQLEFTKSSRIYDTLEAFGDSLPLGYSRNIPDKSQQYIEVGQVKKVLKDNQTEDDFFNYSVKEVSFCIEHCGLKKLADICYEKKLDGSFFNGFNDWKELDLTNLDVIILKKIIYEGWRSKDDSTYAVSTHM